MAKIKHPLHRSWSCYRLRDHERFETTQIDEFRMHVTRSIDLSSKPIAKLEEETHEKDFEDRYDYEAYMQHLNNQQVELGGIEELSDELSILALNKKAELSTNVIIDWYLPDLPRKNRHIIDVLKTMLPFDITALDEYPSRDELRLLNNAIKHEGMVSGVLRDHFPEWGEEGEMLRNVGKGYERLQPKVRAFMHAFAQKCKEHSVYE